MKGTGVYGAEAKVEGFSGYLTELLVINYGSFPKALEAVFIFSISYNGYFSIIITAARKLVESFLMAFSYTE
jgi:tRNA nucleotidyltransferase (CCA-adding enzyme)